MLKKILGCHCSTAHKSDDRLILSLSDAMTPAVWVINLSENPSLLLKVEETNNDLFVLQKITSDGKTTTTEELGYYAKKGYAIRAMNKATCALQKSCSFGSWVWTAAKIIVAAGVVLFLATQITQSNFSLSSMASFITAPFETASVPETSNAQAEPSQEIVPSSDPNAVGVPLSADDLLRKRPARGLGF